MKKKFFFFVRLRDFYDFFLSLGLKKIDSNRLGLGGGELYTEFSCRMVNRSKDGENESDCGGDGLRVGVFSPFRLSSIMLIIMIVSDLWRWGSWGGVV